MLSSKRAFVSPAAILSRLRQQNLSSYVLSRGGSCPISGQTPVEEWANGITHGLGLLLSLAAVAILILRASIWGTPWHIVGSSVYGVTLILVYLASTLYHSSRNTTRKRWFRDVDQAVIFLFIAGTYTAFTLGPLKGGWGWSLFGVAWGLAVLGIVLKICCNRHFKKLSIPLYLGMGWLCLIGAIPMIESLPQSALLLLAGGGVAYSLGTVFFIWRTLPFQHAIWHLAVILGSSFHYFAVPFMSYH